MYSTTHAGRQPELINHLVRVLVTRLLAVRVPLVLCIRPLRIGTLVCRRREVHGEQRAVQCTELADVQGGLVETGNTSSQQLRAV